MCTIKGCTLKNFKNENKCILHCEKNDFSNSKVLNDIFWKELNNYIMRINREFEAFNKGKDNIEIKGGYCFTNISFSYYFYEIKFPSFSNALFEFINQLDINFINCDFSGLSNFNSIKNGNNINFQNCSFYGDVDITNVILSKNFTFNYCKVYKVINFSQTKFKGIFDISNSSLNEINLDFAIFENIASFSNTKIKLLNLSNTIFSSTQIFLNINLAVINRETARIIKNSFEQQNNIIEANRFYALEMKEREKELDKDRKDGKNYFEWLVFKIHGLSSNHSQDWLRALFWIFIIGFLSAYYDFNLKENNFSIISLFQTLGLLIIIIAIENICKTNKEIEKGIYYLTTTYLTYSYSTDDYLLEGFSKVINISSLFKGNDPINIVQLIFKIIIAYLIYQLIISIRQNTRRK